jgi:preprotein translocase subunit SecF
MEIIKPGRQFDFMRVRWWFIGASLTLLALSAISFFYPGPKVGTDFKGGTEIEITFNKPSGGDKPVSAGDVRAAVEKVGFDSPEVVSVGNDAETNRFLIRVQEVTVLSEQDKDAIRQRMCLVPENGAVQQGCPPAASASEIKFSPGGDKIFGRYDVAPDLAAIKAQLVGAHGIELRAGEKNPLVTSERDHRVEIQLKSRGDQLLDGLRAQLGASRVPEVADRVEWIGPKAGAQLRDAAIKSIAIACFFIMAYIAFRFDLRFAPGGIVALVHDVGIAMGAMIIARKEITLSTVAAMLTIVGYSITDTVVVYDRIRENLGKHRNMSFAQVINLSVSEMLGRTIITSGTVVLSLVAFLFWGTGALKDFAFALLVGVAVGTYSSIYVAAPITEWVDRRFFGASADQKKVITRTRAAKKADAVV